MGEVLHRLHAAINSHDIDEFVALFAPDYRSDQPAHPSRRFEGADKVRENWTSVFTGIPDIVAELVVDGTTDEGVEMGEWYWHGTHLDGSRFAMSGVIVLGVDAGTDHLGPALYGTGRRGRRGHREMVRQTYPPPPAATGESRMSAATRTRTSRRSGSVTTSP